MYDELTGIAQVSFKWNSGTTPLYTNWAAREPELHVSDANYKCVALGQKDSNQIGGDFNEAGQWAITQCNYKLPYVCKKPFENVPTTPLVTATPGCPPVRKLNTFFVKFLLLFEY